MSPALEREGFSLIHSFTWHFFTTSCVPRPVQKMTGQKKKNADRFSPPRPSLVSSIGLGTERAGGQGGRCVSMC